MPHTTHCKTDERYKRQRASAKLPDTNFKNFGYLNSLTKHDEKQFVTPATLGIDISEDLCAFSLRFIAL